MISVNIIGSGNVGWHLHDAFSASQYVIINQWVVRSKKSNIMLSEGTEVVASVDELTKADITLIAVPDDQIVAVSQAIPYSNELVVHTSGSLGVHDLDARHQRGVFYPLQTFSKAVAIDFKEVPVCIETIDKAHIQQLQELADAIGSTHYKIYTPQRQTLHLAAVFVNNFTNQLYRIAHELVDVKNIPFDILKPLILETAKKVQEISPYMAQTGPAVRNDKKTIRRHIKQLESDQHKTIYEILTKAIQQTHGKKL